MSSLIKLSSTMAATSAEKVHSSQQQRRRRGLPPRRRRHADEETLRMESEKEQELVEKVCEWTLRVLTFLPGTAAFIKYRSGHDVADFGGPGAVSLSCLLIRSLKLPAMNKGAAALLVLVFVLFRQIVAFQGCSASTLTAIYGFVPGASALLFRSTRAVWYAAALVLTIIASIHALDMTGTCPSEPLDAANIENVIASRLLPLCILAIGNSVIISVILRQSQESLWMHAEAAKSARLLANLRRDVLHRVTHELRTPLNGLVGSVELLTVSETLTAPEDLENVLVLKRCLNSILNICDDVLVTAKESERRPNNTREEPEQGDTATGTIATSTTPGTSTSSGADNDGIVREPTEQPLDLASTIDHVVEVFAATVHAKGVQLKVEFDGLTNVAVRGMEVPLRQTLLNLCSNAIKFTDEGSVTIRVETKEEENDMMRCLFEVCDTGIGIDSHDADLLFEPFHQGEGGCAVSRRHQGTGLGLTICRDLVHQMSGSIAADGARGQGARFYFTLRMKRVVSDATTNPSASVSSPSHAPPRPIENARIVVVDSQRESYTTCQSVVQSVAPSLGSSFDSVQSLSLLLTKDDVVDHKCRRVALVEYNRNDQTFAFGLSQAYQAGWTLIVYCDRGDFAEAASQTADCAYAVLRRPLPLVRLSQTLREALDGVQSPSLGPLKRRSKRNTVRRMSLPPSMPLPPVQSSNNDNGIAEKRKLEVPESTRVHAKSRQKCLCLDTAAGRVVEKVTKMTQVTATRQTKFGSIAPNAQLVVVDDTPVNVKVLEKMLSRCTTTPIAKLYDGESAIELVQAAKPDDVLLFLMDWHMPGVCGLQAAESIRRIVHERQGPHVFVCMVTADVEGFCTELEQRRMTCGGYFSRTGVLETPDANDQETSRDIEETKYGGSLDTTEFAVVDVVSGKPVTFQCVEAILTWFRHQVMVLQEDRAAPNLVALPASSSSSAMHASLSTPSPMIPINQ